MNKHTNRQTKCINEIISKGVLADKLT